MKPMRLALAAMLSLSLVACGEDEPPPPPDERTTTSSLDEFPDGDAPEEDAVADDAMEDDQIPADMQDEESESMAAISPQAPAPAPAGLPVARAVAYQLVRTDDISSGDERRLRIWILAPRAGSAVSRAQTVLRAAADVLNEDGADRVEAHLLPEESEVLAGTEFTLADGTYAIDADDLANGSWEVRATGNTIPDLSLVATELYAENAKRFRSRTSGKVKEKALMSYVARILATSPRAVQRTMRNVRKVIASKKFYSTRR